MSDPQLRKDIVALTLERAELRARIAELEAAPPKVVVKEVIKEVPAPYPVVKEVVKHVKCPKQAAIIRDLRAKLRGE